MGRRSRAYSCGLVGDAAEREAATVHNFARRF